MYKLFRALYIVAIVVFVLGLIGVVVGQDMEPVEPLALTGEPVVIEFSTAAAGPPTVEPLTDGRMTFRVESVGEATGGISGSITARVSEVTVAPSPPFHPITVMFRIETEQGELEGYYTGSFHLADGGDHADVSASGQILSVSGAYADLYLADVFVSTQVQFVDGRAVGDSGILTIAAR